MSITRINRFRAREGQSDAVLELIGAFLPVIEASEGCRSCQLLQRLEDPTEIVVIEVWESSEAHQAAMKNIPAEALQATMKLLVSSPKGAYYRS